MWEYILHTCGHWQLHCLPIRTRARAKELQRTRCPLCRKA